MKTYLLCWTMVALVARGACAGIQIGLTEHQKENSTNEWGAVTYNTQISLGLTGPQREFKTNQVIDLLVRIRNLSTNEDYSVGVQTPFTATEDVSFLVISPSGKDISPVFHSSFRFSGGVVWVHPGQVDGFVFQLGEICRMEEVGTYKIVMRAVRRPRDRHRSFEVLSNPLYFSVVP